jgi:hypothetical protein
MSFSWALPALGTSDHDIVFHEMNITIGRKHKTPRTINQYKKADWGKIHPELKTFQEHYFCKQTIHTTTEEKWLSTLVDFSFLYILSLFQISLLISGVSHGISCFCLSVFVGTCLSIISWILVLIDSHFSSVVVCIVCLQK